MSMIGTVLRFDAARGFGFVAPADGSPDVFVHESDILAGEELMKGDKISFDAQFDEKKNKMMAINCQIAEYSPSRPRQSFLSCVSDQSRLSTVSPMHHHQQHHASMMLMAPSPAMSMHSPQNDWEQQQQQQFFMMQQQQQFFEQQQAQMMDQQFCMQPQHNFMMSPTTITTVFVDDVNMMMQ